MHGATSGAKAIDRVRAFFADFFVTVSGWGVQKRSVDFYVCHKQFAALAVVLRMKQRIKWAIAKKAAAQIQAAQSQAAHPAVTRSAAIRQRDTTLDNASRNIAKPIVNADAQGSNNNKSASNSGGAPGKR